MAVARPVDLPVRWELSMHPDQTASLTFIGELDTVSTPVAWTALEMELEGSKLSRLEVDLRQLVSVSLSLATARDWRYSTTYLWAG